MKKLLAVAVGLALLTALTQTVLAADAKVIKGEAMCTKCSMKETEKCGLAIKVKDGDKETVYYAKNNKVCKDFHDNICKSNAKVIATGTVSEKDGKTTISLSDIKVDKD